MDAARRWALALGCIVGCGPDEAPTPAELDEVCGEPSPFRLLALDEDEQVVPQSLAKIDERLYFVVGPLLGPEDLDDDPFTFIPEVTTTRVIATGPCGESPVEVARDVFRVFEDERFPGHVLGCTSFDGGDLVQLDPTGATPPRTLMFAPACSGAWTDHGVVGTLGQGPEAPPLLLAPYPVTPESAPVPSIELADSVPVGPWLAIVEDDVFAATPSGELLRISLPSGAATVEQSDVEHWGISSDGRILAWRSLSSITKVEDSELGTVTFRDRELGTELRIDNGWFNGSLSFVGYARVRVGAGWDAPTKVVRIPDLAVFELPADRQFVTGLPDDDRWLTSAGGIGPPFHVRNVETGVETALADASGMFYGVFDSGVLVRDADDFVDFSDSALWRLPIDGSAAELLARRSADPYRYFEDGLVTGVSVDEHWFGDLVFVERGTLEEQSIDQRVFAWSPWFDEGVFGERDVLYAVTDGDRSGVWLARLWP